MADRAPRPPTHGSPTGNDTDARSREVREAGRDALGFATVLGSRLSHADDGLALSTILTSARRVVALVEARERFGGTSDRLVLPVDLGDALRRVLDLNRMAFTARGVALTTEPAPGVMVQVDELALDVTLSVLCCWAVLRAPSGSEVHAGVRALDDAPTVRFRLAVSAPEDGCIRIARSLAGVTSARLTMDEERGLVELALRPA
jgi:hypothetical protein